MPAADSARASADRPGPWWRSAVIYQVYIRSFADGSGDGVGDIAGIRSKLRYLADLGVDAVWINPWFPSPMADAGYDVSDYRAIEPVFGTMDEATALLAEAHDLGIRVLLDLVPNHTSDQHAWFQAALAAGPGSPERERYIFRPGRGRDGSQPPNDWKSVFGGIAWERVPDGEWYLHLFAPEQPDLNWMNAEVRDDFEQTLRFWFDLGVDGFRIDVAHSMVKAPGLPDVGSLVYDLVEDREDIAVEHPYWDRDEIHDIFRSWRKIADSYDPPRIFVAEAWVPHPERLARYVRSDELHTAFNFEFLVAPWVAADLREAVDSAISSHDMVGAPPTWVLSNHDVARHLSKLARPQHPGQGIRHLDDVMDEPVDLDLGRRRARAAALLMLALPGGAYVYQGEELGLPEVEDLPDDVLQDPTWTRSEHTVRGRDGCRVPIPWSGTEPPYGFSPAGTATWLPQPKNWGALTAEAEAAEPDSVLSLYRAALAERRRNPALGDGTLDWQDAPDGALIFTRPGGFSCIVNVSAPPLPLPPDAHLLVASGPLGPGGTVPADTTVWLTTE